MTAAPCDQFFASGWAKYQAEQAILDWVHHALPYAIEAACSVSDPSDQLRCGGTWFVGLDALPNTETGQIGDGPPLSGQALSFAQSLVRKPLPLHPGQASTIYPGYPKPMAWESEAAFRFRTFRDAAHLDGLLPTGPDRRRMLKEPHAFILGLPLTMASADASPLVIWEGSHHIMRQTFESAFAGISPDQWADMDVTEIYQKARQQVFEQCRRVTIHGTPGEAYVIHRMAVHGVAPWGDRARAAHQGRMIAYFRPELAQMSEWLSNN